MPSTETVRPRRVILHGLPYFCNKLQAALKDESWDIQHYPKHSPSRLAALVANLAQCDLAFTWGGRVTLGKFLCAAKFLGKEKLVMLWSGSDVLFAQRQLAAGPIDSWVKEKIHWAVSPFLAEEVRALGLSCEYVQASFVQTVRAPAPLPASFSVLTYVPGREKADLYGLDQILEVANRLPSVNFALVGWPQGQELRAPTNLTVHDWMSDLTPFIEQSTVIWRPVRHDAGISFMVLDALAHGRHVLYSYPFVACTRSTNAQTAHIELERLLALHDSRLLSLNDAGIQAIAREFTSDKVRATLLKKWGDIISYSPPRALQRLPGRNPEKCTPGTIPTSGLK